MGIDRIGKGGGVPPSPDGAGGTGAVAPKTETGKTFEVEKPGAAERAANAANVDATAAASPLAKLRAGEIDVNQYVDLKVDEATKPLTGVGSVELDEIKSVLREQLKNDPALVDLVRNATGKMPSPSED